MSRMPGRGTSPGSRIMCLASCRESGRRERHGIAAERQQPVERRAKLRAKGVEAHVRYRHKSLDLDQMDGSVPIAARKKGAHEPHGGQELRDPFLTDRRRTLRCQQGAVETTFLVCA